MIRLIHTGDIHPSSKATFAGKTMIDPATGKNMSLTDLRRSLEFLFSVATAPGTRCDACVIPGDVFDSVMPTMDEIQIIVEWVEQMADAMPVLIVPGNHDMSPSGNMASALEPLKMRANIFIMERPQSVLLDLGGQHVRFFGLPYPQKGRLLVSEDHRDKSPEEITAIVNHGLAAILRAFTLEFETGVPNVLLAHGSVANATVGEQPRSLAHDVLIPLQELLPFDFTALAHIHGHQQVGPTAWYCGSLLRQSFGEEHEEKGFNLVSLEPGHPARVAFVHNPHARVYSTISYSDYLSLMDEGNGNSSLVKDIVWRFKATLSPEQWQACKLTIDRWQQETPFFQLDVEILTEDRARDAGMAQCVSMDAALARVLVSMMEEAEIPTVIEKHQTLVQEVAS